MNTKPTHKRIEEQVEEFVDAWSQSGWMDLAAGDDDFKPALVEILQERDRIAREEENARIVAMLLDWHERDLPQLNWKNTAEHLETNNDDVWTI